MTDREVTLVLPTDTEVGAFLQPDPLGPLAPERYAYASNNPVRYWDPTGLLPQSISGGLGSFGSPGFGGGGGSPGFGGGTGSPGATSQSVTGNFGVPVVPGAGSVRGEFFIASDRALILQGDGRTFDPAPNPARSRAFFTLDFESGAGSFQINPSCFAGGFGCQAALPLGEGNRFNTASSGNTVVLGGSLLNSILPGPSIDFGIAFSASSGGVSFGGFRNAFPSFELTRTVNGTTSVLLNSPETNPARLFDATGFEFFSGP